MPTVYRPRRPRASPLWQIIHQGWDQFQTHYEADHRKTHGPLRTDTIQVIEKYYRCGDLAQGFTRLHCPDCGHEKLIAFTCKTRGFCPSCHQRRALETADWIARDITFDVPHRMYVFTVPKVLRSIFRKRRKLLTHLFQQSIEALKLWMQTTLELPHGQIAAIAVVHTFGDYLSFHPHIHILGANGLIDAQNRFHPLDENESVASLKEIFRNLFIKTLVEEKLLSRKKAEQLLSWRTSGFTLDAGDLPTLPFDRNARRQFAEYMLRAPFSLEKIHWNEKNRQVIYRSKRSWHTKQNYQIFAAADFIAASVEHIPPKGQQTIRYYGRYSNKRRGWETKNRIHSPQLAATNLSARKHDSQFSDNTLFILPEPTPKKKHTEKRDWKSLIKRIWGGDPTTCPCCRAQMKNVGTIIRRTEIEFFLKLWGMWEGVISLPPPPDPPFNIETMEPETVPPGWKTRWPPLPEEHLPPPDEWLHQNDSEAWRNPEFPLEDGKVLVLDAEPLPAEEFPVFSIG